MEGLRLLAFVTLCFALIHLAQGKVKKKNQELIFVLYVRVVVGSSVM